VTESHALSLAHDEGATMTDHAYWLRRKRASLNRARNATSAEARLAHFDLAGRYSIKAAVAASIEPPLPHQGTIG